MGPTAALAQRIVTAGRPPTAARTVAGQALLDFIGVTLAGSREPLSRMLQAQSADEGGHPQAAVIGAGRRASVRQAALANGAAGHAHDYDDVHDAMVGHPTVPVAPVVLALGEHLGASGAELVAAFCAGVDTECIIGRYAGPGHYARGWHATATLGTFGAAAAAARLLGLDAARTAAALGIAGSRAAGLKAQFGTMTKPLHAGAAAAAGLEAAQLAGRGLSSRGDILEAHQGFLATQAEGADLARFEAALAEPAFVPQIGFKYHAACYLTHGAIEAALALRRDHGLAPDDVDAVTVTVNAGHFDVCNIQNPATGLEAKFSLRFTVAMALAGDNTADIHAYTDDLTRRPDLVALRDRVVVAAHPALRPETRVAIRTRDGRDLAAEANVAVPATDLDAQRQRLAAKFQTLAAPVVGSAAATRIEVACRALWEADDVAPLWQALNAPPLARPEQLADTGT
ncbi:MAG: MmgE/PrpD family protein [Pseudomonadales bacterium]